MAQNLKAQEGGVAICLYSSEETAALTPTHADARAVINPRCMESTKLFFTQRGRGNLPESIGLVALSLRRVYLFRIYGRGCAVWRPARSGARNDKRKGGTLDQRPDVTANPPRMSLQILTRMSLRDPLPSNARGSATSCLAKGRGSLHFQLS